MLRSLTDCTCSVHSLTAHAPFTHHSCNRIDGGPRFCLSTQTEVCFQKRERTPFGQPSRSDSTKWLSAAMSWCPTRWFLRSLVLWPANVRKTLYLVLALEGFLNKPQSMSFLVLLLQYNLNLRLFRNARSGGVEYKG